MLIGLHYIAVSHSPFLSNGENVYIPVHLLIVHNMCSSSFSKITIVLTVRSRQNG